MSLSPAQENYLETIYLCEKNSKVVRVKNLASELDIKPSSVHEALAALKERGLVEHERYGYIGLTDEGRAVAEATYGKHKVIKRMLLDVLGLEEERAEREACSIEHFLSWDTVERIRALNGFVESGCGREGEWKASFSDFVSRKTAGRAGRKPGRAGNDS